MFEKESKEYTEHVRYTKTRWNCHEIFDEDLENAYQKGAICGYNKANEWNKVSEKGLPTHEGLYALVFNSDSESPYNKNKLKYHFEELEKFADGEWCIDLTNLVAWKEITPFEE